MVLTPSLRGCRIHAVGDGARAYPWRKPARRLPYHLLVLSQGGEEVVSLDDRRVAVPSGGSYLIAAGQRAAIGSPTGNRPVFVHCDLVVDGQAAERAAWNWFSDPEGHAVTGWQPSPGAVLGAEIDLRPPAEVETMIRRRLPTVVTTWRRGDALAVAEAENLLEALFLAWARAVAVRPVIDEDERRIARAEAVARQQLDTPFGVVAFAAAAGLGRSQFHHLYRRLRGEAPGDFLRRSRNEVASAVLMAGGGLAEAAAAAGFGDRAAFSRFFARANGWSPGRWKRRHRRDELLTPPLLQ